MVNSGRETKRFFGVRGFMKSGTNWLGALLNLHPQIACLGEFHFHEIMQTVYQRVHSPYYFGDVTAKQNSIRYFEQAIERCLLDAAPEGAELIGDRTPAPLAPVVLRGVPYLVILRDGRDVLVSRVFHLFNKPHVTKIFERSQPLRQCLERFQANEWHFREHPEELLANEELVRNSVQSWRKHLEADRKTAEKNQRLVVKFIRYEDLHQRLTEILPSIYEFLDVDPLQAQPPTRAELPGIPQKSPYSFMRRGEIGDWRNYFQPQTRTWFEEEAGDELSINGYLDEFPW